MKTINLMLKPASSLCNMHCKYCFYADVSEKRDVSCSGIMSDETVDAILHNLRRELQPGDFVQFAFQGGEPTLAGLPFFRRFMGKVAQWQGIRVSCALQTNGLLLDEEWCAFLKEHRFLVGLSLDLLPKAHDDVRVDARCRFAAVGTGSAGGAARSGAHQSPGQNPRKGVGSAALRPGHDHGMAQPAAGQPGQQLLLQLQIALKAGKWHIRCAGTVPRPPQRWWRRPR